jgi:hypothetical protein
MTPCRFVNVSGTLHKLSAPVFSEIEQQSTPKRRRLFSSRQTVVFRKSLVFTYTIVMTSNPEKEFVLQEAKPDTNRSNAEVFKPAVT